MCPCTLFDDEHRADGARGRRHRRRSPSGVRFTRRQSTARSPASGSTRARTTPAPTPARCGPPSGTAAGHRHVHRRVDHRLADADVRPAGARSPRTPSTSRRTARRRAATRRRPNAFSPADLSRGPAARDVDCGRLHLRHRVPVSSSGDATTWSTWSSRGRRRRSPSRAQDPAPAARSTSRATSRSRSCVLARRSAPGYTMAVSVGGDRRSPARRRSAPDGTALTFTPAAPLPADADVDVSADGRSPRPRARSLPTRPGRSTTAGADGRAPQTLFGDQVPGSDAGSTTARRSSWARRSRPPRTGQVTAIRFYKGAGNAGTHTGSLWSRPARGWRRSPSPARPPPAGRPRRSGHPVAVTRGDDVRRVLLRAQGHYSYTPGFFANAVHRRRPDGPGAATTAATSTARRAASRRTPGDRPTTSSTWCSSATADDHGRPDAARRRARPRWPTARQAVDHASPTAIAHRAASMTRAAGRTTTSGHGRRSRPTAQTLTLHPDRRAAGRRRHHGRR